MLYSTYRPPLAPSTDPRSYDKNYADDFHHRPHPHASLGAPGSVSVSSDRFEYKGQHLLASTLESRLYSNALVRDCSVIGVSQSDGAVITLSSHQAPMLNTTPIAFVALSSAGKERSAHGGDKESKRMKSELIKWIVDFAPPFKLMKGKLLFVEAIARAHDGSVLRHLLVEKATSPPLPAPDKGFFNTVLSESSTPAAPSKAASVVGDMNEPASPPKRTARDSKRRATHSQIERRRREKINDRLVTLRSIVPACAKELEDRRRQKQEEQDEAARIAAGGAPKTYIDAATGKPKRKRNRKKPDTKKPGGADKEEELGLHKLEVLTHAINYIFELKAIIHKLETGSSPEHVPTADNPFGVRNKDGTYRQDAKIEDDPGYGLGARTLEADHGKVAAGRSATSAMQRECQESEEEDDGEQEEVEQDQLEDDVTEGDDEQDTDAADDDQDDQDDDEDEPLGRRSKKHMTCAAFSSHTDRSPASHVKVDCFVVPKRYRHTDAAGSSSSSRGSAEVSPAFSLIQQSPSTISPATTVTSPMMSLSAESPIMLPDSAMGMSKRAGPTASRVSQSPVFSSLPASALPLPSGLPARRESSSFLFKQLSLTSPNFTPFTAAGYYSGVSSCTAASVATAAGGARVKSTTLSFATTYGEESEVRETSSSSQKTPGLSDRDMKTDHVSATVASDASAAELLLNFSTSPEVLRPIGSSSQSSSKRPAHRPASMLDSSPHTRPMVGLTHNNSRSTFSCAHYRPTLQTSPSPALFTTCKPTTLPAPNVSNHQLVSPVNHAHALPLASPPLLALDSSSPLDDDHLSDKTIDDLPESVVKLEASQLVGHVHTAG